MAKGPAARRITFTGAEARGGFDGTGQVPSCVIDLFQATLEPGGRVLLAGPHHDAVALRLAEAGHTVHLQLRSLADAEAAAERLPASIDVRCGSLRDAVGTYGAVIALGGLQYLYTGDAPLDGWAGAIELLAGRVAPGGLLAIAVRNGFGIDRLTDATVGIPGHRRDDYAADHARMLATLSSVGLRTSAEYSLYPNTTAPEILVHTGAYASGGDTLATVIASAYRSVIGDPHTLTDPRRIVRDSLEHGLGAALAPGWLTVAWRTPGDIEAAPIAVLVTDARADEFRSAPYMIDGSRTRRLLLGGATGVEHRGGLVRDARRLDGVPPSGRLLEERFIDAAGGHDLALLRDLVNRFSDWLGVPDRAQLEAQPTFAMLDNVVDDGADLRVFDPSWSTAEPVAAEVVFVAAMHRFAGRILAGALPHPWTSAQSPGRLAARLASMADLTVTPDLLEAASDYGQMIGAALDGRLAVGEESVLDDVPSVEAPPVPLGPVDPVGPVARPAGLAEASRTIEALSAELVATHDQLALLTATIVDLDKRYAKARRKASRIESSRIYQAAVFVARPLRKARKAARKAFPDRHEPDRHQ